MTTLLLAAVLAPPAFFDQPYLTGAHRGGVSVGPESTAWTFAATARRWPEMVLETDVRLSKDGQTVLLHDETVDRTTDGKGRIEEMTFAEIRRLDAGYRFTTDGGRTFPFRGKGIRIATLAEALRAAPRSRFELDLKSPDVVPEVARIVRAQNAESRILLASFVPAAMSAARAALPSAATSYDFVNGARLLSALRGPKWASYVPEADMVSIMKEQVVQYRLTDEEIRRIRDRGIQFQIHTLDTPQQIRTWLGRGVDSILTDHPEILADEVRDRPLARAHAHNDYMHRRPLLDALDQKFLSVEADIFLVDGELRVGHDRQDLRPGRTLETLYLDPLWSRYERNHGTIYDRPGQLQLLVDIKENGTAVYSELQRRLPKYQDMLSGYRDGKVVERAVKVVLSGDRPVRELKQDPDRLMFLDGRLADFGAPLVGMPESTPLVSNDYGSYFHWNGKGTMPPYERDRLRLMVEQVHALKAKFRLWGVPDSPDAWRTMYDAGVDWVNTDDLTGLAKFLRPRG